MSWIGARNRLPVVLFVVAMAATLALPRGAFASSHVIPSGVLWVSLVACGVIDIREQRLPDVLTLPLIVLGLAFSARLAVNDLLLSALGAAIGYGLISGLRLLWLKTRHIEAIGLGDAKLLAALGAWLGAAALPIVLLVASGSGILIVVFMRLAGKSTATQERIAFGPFIAISGWMVWWLGPLAGLEI